MFCQNCGSQIPNGSKFCNSCGAKIAYAAPAQPVNKPAQPQNEAPQQPQKKKSGGLGVIILAFIVFAFAWVGGRVIADNLKSNKSEPTEYTYSTIAINPEIQETEAANSEYSRVFTDRGLMHIPTVFFGLESDSYVCVLEDGVIDNQQFGHKNDLVVEFVETLYVPTEGWTDAEKETYKKNVQDAYGNSGLYFATLTFNVVAGDYISFSLALTDMDKEENVKAANDEGFIIMDEGYTLWGMSGSEENLLASGYIKK